MVEYLNKLTPEELGKFGKFLMSTYFNSNTNLVKLYDYLHPSYPKIENINFDKLKLSINIFSEKRINEVKIRKLISDFTIALEKFLTQIEVEKNYLGNKISLINSLRKRGLSKRCDMGIREVDKIQKVKFSKDSEYYYNQINLESAYFYYNFSNFKLEYAECLQKRSDNLDYYFIFNKLHTFNEMSFNEISKNKSFNKSYLNEIINFLEVNREIIHKKHPNIFIIYLVMMMRNTSDDKYLTELLDYLNANEKKFTKENLSYYYHYVRTYYIVKINSGQSKYLQPAFDIIKLMEAKRLFLIDNIITDMEFNSVVNMVLPLKEYEWLNDFIDEYSKYLDPSFSKDAYNLAKAKMLYEKKEFEKIYSHLNEVEFRDPNYYYNSKFIMGRVNFEMKNLNGVKYIISNLRQYLRTKEILTPDQIAAIKTFNKYMTNLIELFESESSKKKSLRTILKKELDNEKKIVPNKNWFYEKLEEK
ncbi:MAG: hypothetical protein M3R36_10630 [Bacteroidota bacterium]|nr:hypothetical protein [Bacteroidota bacterium]